MSSQNSMSSAYVQLLPIFIPHFQRALHLYSTHLDRPLYWQHVYYLCWDNTPPSTIFCLYNIFPTHVQSIPHLSCTRPVGTPPMQLMSSIHIISTVHLQIVPDSTAHMLTTHVQTVPTFYGQCQVSTSSLQLISRQYQIYKSHFQSVSHFYSQCPVCT